MFPELLRGITGNLPEVPVKCGKGTETCPGGDSVDGVIGPFQFITGAPDADLIDIFDRGHFHVL